MVKEHRPLLGGSGKLSAGLFVMLSLFSLAMVDVIFADVAQPDQTRIVALNAHTFLRNGGHFVISIKVWVLKCKVEQQQSMVWVLDYLWLSLVSLLVLFMVEVKIDKC